MMAKNASIIVCSSITSLLAWAVQDSGYIVAGYILCFLLPGYVIYTDLLHTLIGALSDER